MAESRAGYVLRVDKPEGPTSHDVVAMARRALGVRRIGHTGTLDPFASGLLLLCVGPATRIAQYLVGLGKTYHAVVRFGEATDTCDRTGEVLACSESWRGFTREAVGAALSSMLGPQAQVPPAYSAKKVAGIPLHRRARRGEVVTPEPAAVEVHAMDVLRMELPDLELQIACSSGTYVRALARDLGDRLGTPAHLLTLRRLRIGSHRVEDAVTPDLLADPAALHTARIPLTQALGHLPALQVDASDAERLQHGVAVPATTPRASVDPAVVVSAGEVVAIAQVMDGWIRPRKVLVHD